MQQYRTLFQIAKNYDKYTWEQMLSTEGEKANFKVDTYGETFDIDYLNKIFLEKCNWLKI